ncbi:MAG: hypothetical protein DDT21_01424 [Syntrophomonadaceae bacterium]|nr:hypothetical protein [Bacillota bacterium]
MRYEVTKKTQTYADTMTAVGLASLLAELTNSDFVIQDRGAVYLLEGPDLPSPADWVLIEPGYPYIYLLKDGKRPAGWVVDYEQEREKDKQHREFRKAAGKKREKLEQLLREQGEEGPPPPVPELKLAVFLASMRKGWASDKSLYEWITEDQTRATAWVAQNLTHYHYNGKDYIGEIVKDPPVSNSQVFNPIAGKGIHRPKPDSTTPASISDEVIEPFAEWLKFRGSYRVMLPYRSGGDFKVFVIEPADIKLNLLTKLYHGLRGLDLWGGIKLDIDSALRLTELLITHSDVLGGNISLYRKRPAEVVKGLHQAYFQSLGTAAALMNYSFLALPSWFCVEGQEDAKNYLALIKAFIGHKERDGVTGCLRSLSEERSGDIPVLQQFRKWLMTGTLKEYLEFCYRFSLHQMERMSKDEWIASQSTANLNIIFERGYNMLDIIQTKGFQSVARALREATIYALAAQKQKRTRDVHFGLSQKWKQKIKGGNEEFTAALCEFVQQYNWESENIDVNKKESVAWKQHKVNAAELGELINLINSRGAELVGMLLLAYGYARTLKADTAAPEQGQVEEEKLNEN